MKLELTEQEIGYIYSILLEQRAKDVRGILDKIELQVDDQQTKQSTVK